MKPSTPAPASRSPRRQGSAILLAVVIVVLMTMMGAAYLQVARTDRRTSVDVDTRANVDNGSILRYIAQVLGSDVPVTPGGESPEPYDFPWTNPNVPTANNEKWAVPDRFSPVPVPGPQPDFTSDNNNQPARSPRADGDLADPAGNFYAEAGPGDDTWLGSTEPDFGSDTWPHITNLMGVFLDLRPGSLVTDAFGNIYPTQYLSTADADLNSGDTGLPLAAMTSDHAGRAGFANLGSRFADADGDDIADSRWTWAPLPSDAGLAYVMAVRIVDNSALVDLNAWTEPAGPASADGARWNWPGELDLARSLAEVSGAATGGTLTAADVMLSGTARAMAGTNAAQRYENWLTTTSTRGGEAESLDSFEHIGAFLEREQLEGNTPATADGGEDAGALTRQDEVLAVRAEEIELRWKSGVNRSDDNAAPNANTELEDLSPGLFRAGALETDWTDTPYGTFQTFFENEPRKQLTTISGSSNAGRVNLNTGDPADIAAVFANALDYNAGTERKPVLFDNSGWADYFSSGTPADDFRDARVSFGIQAAAVVADHRDDDSKFTRIGSVYGMERVPVITEVRAQARYTASNVAPDPGEPLNVLADWTYQDHAVVIELLNPWPVPTIITGVELRVDGESWGQLDALLGKDVMFGHELAVIRRPDAAGVGPAQNPITDAGVDTDVAKAADPDDYPVDSLALDIDPDVAAELFAEDSEGDPVAYQSVRVYRFPATQTGIAYAATGPNSVGNGDTRYISTRRAGTANGLNALAAQRRLLAAVRDRGERLDTRERHDLRARGQHHRGDLRSGAEERHLPGDRRDGRTRRARRPHRGRAGPRHGRRRRGRTLDDRRRGPAGSHRRDPADGLHGTA